MAGFPKCHVPVEGLRHHGFAPAPQRSSFDGGCRMFMFFGDDIARKNFLLAMLINLKYLARVDVSCVYNIYNIYIYHISYIHITYKIYTIEFTCIIYIYTARSWQHLFKTAPNQGPRQLMCMPQLKQQIQEVKNCAGKKASSKSIIASNPRNLQEDLLNGPPNLSIS